MIVPTAEQLVGWYIAQYEADGRDVVTFYPNELTNHGPYTITPDSVTWQIHIGKIPGLVYELTEFDYDEHGQVVYAAGMYHRNGDGPWRFTLRRFASFGVPTPAPPAEHDPSA